MTKEASSVKSASRTIDVIEFVSRTGAVNAKEISQATAIPASSLSYLLATLADREWLFCAPDRTYSLGHALLQLGQGAVPSRAEILRRLLVELARKTGETTSLFHRRGYEIEAVDVELSRQALRFSPNRGLVVPVHCFAGGKAMLARWPDEELEAYLADGERSHFTANTLVDAADIRRELELIRQRGYAIAREEYTPGVVAIGMALDAEYAISIAMPSSRFSPEFEALAVDALRQAISRL